MSAIIQHCAGSDYPRIVLSVIHASVCLHPNLNFLFNNLKAAITAVVKTMCGFTTWQETEMAQQRRLFFLRAGSQAYWWHPDSINTMVSSGKLHRA